MFLYLVLFMFTGVQEKLFKVVYISAETLDQIDMINVAMSLLYNVSVNK